MAVTFNVLVLIVTESLVGRKLNHFPIAFDFLRFLLKTTAKRWGGWVQMGKHIVDWYKWKVMCSHSLYLFIYLSIYLYLLLKHLLRFRLYVGPYFCWWYVGLIISMYLYLSLKTDTAMKLLQIYMYIVLIQKRTSSLLSSTSPLPSLSLSPPPSFPSPFSFSQHSFY